MTNEDKILKIGNAVVNLIGDMGEKEGKEYWSQDLVWPALSRIIGSSLGRSVHDSVDREWNYEQVINIIRLSMESNIKKTEQ